MNPILYLIYYFLKVIVLTSFKIFYKKTLILHPEKIKFKGPGIVVGNHPSTMTDPLNVAARVPRIVFFLANASLFSTRFTNWFFNTFYCIPIERPKDVEGRAIQNREAFERCDNFLGGGGCLFIAPEGYSKMPRRLQPLKTGTARIALSAEEKKDFSLGLKVYPAGVTYTASTEFRSSVIINFGDPIEIDHYQQQNEEDHIATVRQLTDDIAAAMSALILDTTDDEEDELLHRIEALQQIKNPQSLKKQFSRSQRTLKNLQRLRREHPGDYVHLKNSLVEFENKIKEEGWDKKALWLAGEKRLDAFGFGTLLKLILGFPFFLYGWVNNWLANFFPAKMVNWLKLYVGYTSTVKLLSGLIFYPLFYGLQVFAVQTVFDNIWITLGYFLSLYPFGLFAWEYAAWYRQWRVCSKVKNEIRRNSTKVNALVEEQKALLDLEFKLNAV